MKINIKRYLGLGIVASCLLLSGCASVIRSNVTAFNEWPADLTDKSYTFATTAEQNNDLEYRNYATLIAAELQHLGFTQVASGAPAQLKVAFDYGISSREVRVVEPVVVDPGWPGYPFYGPYWGAGPYGRYYGRVYDPLWYGGMYGPAPGVIVPRESNYEMFTRHLHIDIAHAGNGKKLYEVNVNSEGRIGVLATVMPYLVRSAFTDFPGQSGLSHVVELKLDGK